MIQSQFRLTVSPCSFFPCPFPILEAEPENHRVVSHGGSVCWGSLFLADQRKCIYNFQRGPPFRDCEENIKLENEKAEASWNKREGTKDHTLPEKRGHKVVAKPYLWGNREHTPVNKMAMVCVGTFLPRVCRESFLTKEIHCGLWSQGTTFLN